MTRRKRNRPKVEQKPRIETLRAEAKQAGVPMFLPTAERAERGELTVERITATIYPKDKTGERGVGRKITTGVAIRDRSADAKTRLKRFRHLAPVHIAAGMILESDWSEAGLEPRLVANLLGAGGGSQGGISGAVIDARTRVHEAIKALRLGGDEVLRIVEAVIIRGESSGAVGAARYTDAGRANAHVEACLTAGLNLLAKHYGLGVARTRTTRTAKELA